jgi:hypothetical protein
MIEKFNEATLYNVVETYCGLLIIVSSQFYANSILTPTDLRMQYIWADYDTSINLYDLAFGEQLLIKFSTDWDEEEQYSFDWSTLEIQEDSFIKYIF